MRLCHRGYRKVLPLGVVTSAEVADDVRPHTPLQNWFYACQRDSEQSERLRVNIKNCQRSFADCFVRVPFLWQKPEENVCSSERNNKQNKIVFSWWLCRLRDSRGRHDQRVAYALCRAADMWIIMCCQQSPSRKIHCVGV